jgi:WD40 repeat protein
MNIKIVVTTLLILLLVLVSQVDLQAQARIELFIETLAWSPNGELIAIGGGKYGCSLDQASETTVIVIDITTKSIINTLRGNECRIMSLAWSPDSTKLAVSVLGKLTQIWDISKDTIISIAPTAGGFGRNRPIWSPDGTKIVDVWNEHFVFEIWDSQTGESIRIFGLDPKYSTNQVFSVDWSPDGTQIVSGGTTAFENPNGFVRVWNAETGELIQELEHPGGVFHVDWKPDGTQIASGSGNGEIRIWDAETDNMVKTILGDGGRFRWHPFDDLIIAGSCCETSMITVWDTTTGESIETYDTEAWTPVIDWSPAGGRAIFNLHDVISFDEGRQDTLTIIVPVPTLERMEAIKEYCVSTEIQSKLPSVENREVLPDFLDEIKALPEDTISPACAADLIAVAEALMSEE